MDADREIAVSRTEFGHNNPPDNQLSSAVIEAMRLDATELKNEFQKPKPSIALVKKLGASLYGALNASATWLGGKIDLAIDIAFKTVIPTLVVAYTEPGQKALEAIIAWLGIAAMR